MMKINCFFVFLLLLSQNVLSSKIIDESIPLEPNIILDFTNSRNPLVKSLRDRLNKIIDGEISGDISNYNINNIRDFLPPIEARIYLGDYVDTYLQQYDGDNEAIKNSIFSNKYFDDVDDVIRNRDDFLQEYNVLNGSKDEMFEYYIEHQNSCNLFNVIAYGTAFEYKRVNPLLRFFPPDLIREFFFKKSFWSYESFKTSYNKWNAEIENIGPSSYPREVERTFDDFLGELFATYFCRLPELEDEKKEYFLTHELGFLTDEIIKNTYAAARRILDLSKEGDSFVCFGNTPYFIGLALEKILENEEDIYTNRHVIYLPFSGAPNRFRGGNNFLNVKDIVTQERLSYLRERLLNDGLLYGNAVNLGHTTYFIDVVASGSGPAYVIEEILRDYKRLSEALPDIQVITLNEININNKNDRRNQSIAEQNILDGECGTLFFTNNLNPRFNIPAHCVYLPGHNLFDMFPDQDPRYRMLPSYNAKYWRPEYDDILFQETFMQKILKEYFIARLEQLIKTN